MKRVLVLLFAVWGCGDRSAGAQPRPVLAEEARWSRLAVPLGVALDGQGWIGAADRELVTYDGEREVSRLPLMVTGDAALRPLPDGGWIAGPNLVAADGTVRFSGHSWANRYGRFGSPKAFAFSDDGRVAIVDGADSPSTCLCDRERGTGGSSGGALVRLRFDGGSERAGAAAGRPLERVLIEHADRRDFHVAASARWVAAVEGDELSVWPAEGDGAPITAKVGGPSLQRLAWAGDRYLIGSRHVDVEHSELVVLDRERGFAPSATWVLDGFLRALEVRPGGAEVAVALTRYRARAKVEVDERRVALYDLAGVRRAQVDTTGYPAALAWSPRGDALLVATTGNAAREHAVIRYAVR